MKRCPKCTGVFSLDAFPRSRAAKDGRGDYCKPCHAAQCKASRDKLHGSGRNYLLKLRYGITEAQADLMIAVQKGCCAICQRKRKLHVDHDHRTGVVRGMLCFDCNAGLGILDDDVGRLNALSDYLGRAT